MHSRGLPESTKLRSHKGLLRPRRGVMHVATPECAAHLLKLTVSQLDGVKEILLATHIIRQFSNYFTHRLADHDQSGRRYSGRAL
jgi:hypothetical protein